MPHRDPVFACFGLVCVLCAACGGGPSAGQRRAASVLAQLEADTARLPGAETTPQGLAGSGAVGQPGLQLYAVLTEDPGALQAKADIDAMWQAVNGATPRYAAIAGQIKGLPPDYRVTLSRDYADLPDPRVNLAGMRRMMAALPPETQAVGERARLIIFLRSDAAVLPQGGHVRLVGAAALYTAERWNGVVLDLITRRAWTPAQWRAELSAPALSPGQTRLYDRADPKGGRWLGTRGLPRFGLPDLQVRGVAPEALDAARAALTAARDRLLAEGQPDPALEDCAAPRGFHDGACRQLPAP